MYFCCSFISLRVFVILLSLYVALLPHRILLYLCTSFLFSAFCAFRFLLLHAFPLYFLILFAFSSFNILLCFFLSITSLPHKPTGYKSCGLKTSRHISPKPVFFRTEKHRSVSGASPVFTVFMHFSQAPACLRDEICRKLFSEGPVNLMKDGGFF